MAQRNYPVSTTVISLTASGTSIASGNTQSGTFVVAQTMVRSGMGAGELFGTSQTWSIHYVISAMATPYEMRLKLQRRNSSGVMQSESGYGTVRTATGTYDDNLTWASGTWNAGDQLALVWEHRRPSGSGNKSGTMTANGSSYIDAPAPNQIALTGSAAGTSTASGSLTKSTPLTGSSPGTSTASASLTVTTPGNGITVGAVTSHPDNATTSTISFSHNNDGDYLIVDILVGYGTGSISGVTYNGASMTALGNRTRYDGGKHVFRYGLVAPASGANTVQVTMTEAAVLVVVARSFSGVDQTDPVRATATRDAIDDNPGTGAYNPLNVTVTSAESDLVVDAGTLFYTVSSWTEGSGQTKDFEDVTTHATSSLNNRVFGSTKAGAATSTQTTWTLDSTYPWLTISSSLRAATTGGVNLTGSAAGTSTTSGSITKESALTSTVSGTSTSSANITKTITLGASVSGIGTSTAASLIKSIGLNATTAGVGTSSASLTTAKSLSGAANGSGTSSATLTVTGAAYTATASGASSAAATISLSKPLAATSPGTSASSGLLSIGKALAGTSGGTSTAIGSLTVTSSSSLAATANGTSVASASFQVSFAMTGSAAGASGVSASLSVAKSLSGSVPGVSNVIGSLTLGKVLTGTVPGTGSATGLLSISKSLNGTVAGIASVSVSLTVAKPLTGSATGTSLTSAILQVGELTSAFDINVGTIGFNLIEHATVSISPFDFTNTVLRVVDHSSAGISRNDDA